MKFTNKDLEYGAIFCNEKVRWRVEKVSMNLAKGKLQTTLRALHGNELHYITKFNVQLLEHFNSWQCNFYTPLYEIY